MIQNFRNFEIDSELYPVYCLVFYLKKASMKCEHETGDVKDEHVAALITVHSNGTHANC